MTPPASDLVERLWRLHMRGMSYASDTPAVNLLLADLSGGLSEAADTIAKLEADNARYRDVFNNITAKAVPICGDESDPEKITGYTLPVGPLHLAAGKLGHQMFNGEAHLARAVAEITQLREALRPFADYAPAAQQQVPGHINITQGSWMARRQLTMADCYKARAALNNGGNDGQN